MRSSHHWRYNKEKVCSYHLSQLNELYGKFSLPPSRFTDPSCVHLPHVTHPYDTDRDVLHCLTMKHYK